MTKFKVLKSFVVSVSIGCCSVLGQPPAEQQIDPEVAELGECFVSITAKLNCV